MPTLPDLMSPKLTIIAWRDDVMDRDGHDARAPYVERYWLGVLGPTTILLLRRLADELEANPGGLVIDTPEFAQSLGIGGVGKNSPLAAVH